MTKKKKKIVRIISIFLFVATASAMQAQAVNKGILGYTLLKDSSYETSRKAQVDKSYLVEERPLSKEKLRFLLEYLYKKALTVTDWKHHDKPTVIRIILYASKNDFEAKEDWVAMANKNAFPNSTVSYSISDSQLRGLVGKAGDRRWGLAIEKRKKIYVSIVKAVEKSIKVADEKYPTDTFKSMDYSEELAKKYYKEIAKKHGVTVKQMKKIEKEGYMQKWPETGYTELKNDARSF